MRRPMAVIGITFLSTLVLIGLTGENIAFFLLVASALLFIISILIKNLRQAAVIPAFILSVSAACIMFILQTEYSYKPALELVSDNQCSIEGVIVDNLGENANGTYRYVIKTSEINGKPVKLKIRLSCEELKADYYDKVDLQGKIYKIGNNNEDAHLYFKSSGIYLGTYTYSGIKVTKTKDKPFYYHFIILRETFADTIMKTLPNDEGAVLTAMLLGVRTDLSQEVNENFTDAGVLHIFSVSGMHTSMWSMFIYWALKRTRLKDSKCAFISAVFIVMYMALTAFTPTVLRAGIMTLLYFLGLMLKKEPDSLNSLGLAALLITFASPFSAANIGLLLSFLSTLGIVVLYPKLSKKARTKINNIKFKPVRRATSWASDITIISAVAIIFTLPVMLLSFGRLSLIAPVTNLLVIDASGAAILLSGFAVVFALIPFISILKYPLLLIAGLLAKYMIWCVRVLDKIPFASISLNDEYWSLWFAAVLILIAAVLIIKGDFYKKLRLTAILSVLILLVSMLSYRIANNNITTISVVNVGNGTAIVLSKENHAAIIGCGGDYYAESNIAAVLSENDIKQLDLMLIPRTKDTEMSAASDIISQYSIKKLVVPESIESTNPLLSKNDVTVGDTANISLWGNVNINYKNSNDSSYACTTVGDLKILTVFYPYTDLTKIPVEYQSADILICRASVPKGLDYSRFGIIIISGELEKSTRTAININSQGGNCISAEEGGLTIKTRGSNEFSIRRQAA